MQQSNKLKYPSYINCAFCPAQAYFKGLTFVVELGHYRCVSEHSTYIRICSGDKKVDF